MDDLLSGYVVAVSSMPVGTQTAADALTGDVVLVLDDAIDMSTDGGQVTINGGAVLDYTTRDDDASTITLAVPLTGTIAAGAEVLVYPALLERTAMVLVDGTSDPIPAAVPWHMKDALAVGIREEESRERVRLQRDGEWSWAVYDLPDQVLTRDATFSYVPTASAAKGVDTDIPTNTWTTITGWFVFKSDRVTQDLNSRFTVLVDGEYDLRVGASFASNNTGRRGVRIRFFSAFGTDAGNSRPIIIPADGGTTVETAQYRRMRAGEAVSFEAYQSSTGDLAVRGSNVVTDPSLTDCAIRWMGPL